MKSVGDRIRYARKQAGFTQVQLAELAGTKPGTIGDKEVNRGNPSGPLLKAIEYATGYSAHWLATGEGNPLVPLEKAAGVSEPGPEAAGELLILEFGAWVRRKLIKSPEALDDLEPALRRLINEVEHGPLNALKMDVVAHPDAWGDNLRALVMALPALERRRLMDWLAEQISAQADRDLGPARETAAGGDRK